MLNSAMNKKKKEFIKLLVLHMAKSIIIYQKILNILNNLLL